MGALAAAMAIVSYCVARAFDEFGSKGNSSAVVRELKDLNSKLGTPMGHRY
jgi:hypothetical protein